MKHGLWQSSSGWGRWQTSSYPNEEPARAENSSAYPPDLRLMVKARHGGTFSGLHFLPFNWFIDSPAGVEFMNYSNSFFSGGSISMAHVLFTSENRKTYKKLLYGKLWPFCLGIHAATSPDG
jgi:cytochrome c1